MDLQQEGEACALLSQVLHNIPIVPGFPLLLCYIHWCIQHHGQSQRKRIPSGRKIKGIYRKSAVLTSLMASKQWEMNLEFVKFHLQ